MPLQATSGAASYDGFGGGVAAVPQYIEDVFSTYLFTGNGTTQTVTNGIDLIGKGGMVWRKQRDAAADHFIADTVRGTYSTLSSNTTAAARGSSYIDFLSDGFQAVNSSSSNPSGALQASWTLRKQPKFFDIQTWTGDGTNRAIPHNLGSVPGCMIVKCTNAAYGWMVYHRSTGATKFLYLDTTEAAITNSTAWNDTEPTSTVFTVGNAPLGNESGKTYVAYIFAHDAGGFGLSGTDNVISCGGFTTDGSGLATVSLGYEPQWVLFKQTDGADSWYLNDIMRGMSVSAYSNNLSPNLSAAESAGGYDTKPTATGFNANPGIANKNYIYIAIRRGPMKVPETGTSVFSPLARTGTGAATTITGVGFPPDSIISIDRTATSNTWKWFYDRLRGPLRGLASNVTNAEASNAGSVTSFDMDGFSTTTSGTTNTSSVTYINYLFSRAPSFFDEVCYTGTGVAGRTVTHNLTVAPELMIVKGRSNAGQWRVYSSALGATQSARLNSTDSFGSNPFAWNDTAPTASVFTVGDDTGVNENTYTYVAYLFATCAGVSKVGSYTGTAAAQTINCGFTAGARFVLIKRTDSTGDWYVWDSARGIIAGDDPYLLLNSTAAEVTNTDYIDTYSAGFEISSTAPAAINASGGTFIFLAIA